MVPIVNGPTTNDWKKEGREVLPSLRSKSHCRQPVTSWNVHPI